MNTLQLVVKRRFLQRNTISGPKILCLCEHSEDKRRHVTFSANNRASRAFKRFHDLCLVRPFEDARHEAALDRDSCQLGYRVRRILLPGSGESHRLQRGHIHAAAQDYLGGYHAHGVRGFRPVVGRRERETRFPLGGPLHVRRGLFCLPLVRYSRR